MRGPGNPGRRRCTATRTSYPTSVRFQYRCPNVTDCEPARGGSNRRSISGRSMSPGIATTLPLWRSTANKMSRSLLRPWAPSPPVSIVLHCQRDCFAPLEPSRINAISYGSSTGSCFRRFIQEKSPYGPDYPVELTPKASFRMDIPYYLIWVSTSHWLSWHGSCISLCVGALCCKKTRFFLHCGVAQEQKRF